MNSKTNILLTGASGTVGYEVLKQLIQNINRFDVTVFDIKTTKSKSILKPFSKKVKIIYGDIANIEATKEACQSKDIVIHLAAIIPPLADEEPELAYRVNTLGTGNLITNLEKYSPNAFFLYSSSISVYGDRVNTPLIKVDDPLLPSEGDEYAKTKIKAEEIITKSKLNWSIFRLAAIMGNHKASKLMFHMPLNTSLEIATPEDTARAFVNAIDKQEKLLGKIFNLGGGEECRLSYKDFLSRSFNIFGLGELNFPSEAFAEKNFHCGFYSDGNKLEEILHFRKDTLQSYFSKVKKSTSALQRFVSSILRKQIKNRLLKQSEPRNATMTQNHRLIERFFNKA